MKCRTPFPRPLALALAALIVAGLASAGADPTVEVDSAESPLVTKITLEVENEPVGDLIERIAKEMGFEGVVFRNGAPGDARGSFSFEDRPAWECLAAIFTKHRLSFGGGEIGKDYHLVVVRVSREYEYRVEGGVVARFSQAPAGTVVRDPHHRPCSVWIRPEPRVRWSCDRIAVTGQKDANGNDVDVLGFDLFGGKPQMSLARGASPWPGLTAFTIETTSSFAVGQTTVDIRDLAVGGEPHRVENEDGEELLRIDRVVNAGRFIDVTLSWASGNSSSFVAQGGWGTPPEQTLESSTGWKLTLEARGERMSPGVLVGEGDGTRFSAKIRLLAHRVAAAGGVGNVGIRMARPAKKETREIVFEFADLGD